MTRKDYLLIAAALAEPCPGNTPGDTAAFQWRADCRAIADALAADNPNNFDREQFLTNCGVQS